MISWTITGARPSVGSSRNTVVGAAQQRTRDCHLLLLAAREQAGPAEREPAECGEELVDIERGAAAARRGLGEPEVLGHAEVAHELAALRHECEPAARAAPRSIPFDRRAVDAHGAGRRAGGR